MAAPTTLSPTERSLRARIGAFALHRQYDPLETTAKARATFQSRFLAEQPTDLPEGERLRRAEAAKREHYSRMAYQSSRARSTKRPVPTQDQDHNIDAAPAAHDGKG